MKKFISVILAFTLVFSMFAIGSSASEESAWNENNVCNNGDCEYYPTIIIPGLGQSNNWALDENGDFIVNDEGKKTAAFPAYFQIGEVIKTAIGPLLLTLATQKDMGFTDAVVKIIYDSFSINACDSNGQPSDRVFTEKYPHSLADCTEEERAECCYHHVPLDRIGSDLYPEDHLYYFSYNSFGNNLDLAQELYDYIQMVKEQTGHDKVIISPISQGGTIFNSLLEFHPKVMDDLHKVIGIVPCLDGSTIIGDVFNDRIRFLDADVLYNGFLSTFFDSETASMIEVILRLFPDELIMNALTEAATVLVKDVMTTSTSMWAMCPSRDYLSAAEKHLADRPEIKKQTDKYYQAQLNSDKNIQKLLDKGVQVYNVAEYGIQMYGVGYSYDTENADGIIQLDSTAMGVYSANIGETLPEDYVQQNTFCKNPEHNHISPDRVVDASTTMLADTTIFIKGQKHEQTAKNDTIIKFAIKLLEGDEMKDVFSDPEFPQYHSVEPAPADEGGFFTKLSDFLYEYFGTNGFSELPGLAVKSIFEDIKGIFS